MTSLKQNEIFKLSSLIKNVPVKCSAATEANDSQILCFVLSNDDLFFRYCTRVGEVIVKTVRFFSETSKRVQDVCFDTETGAWLLVLCYDNTLHIVPAVYICDKSAKFKLIFSAQEISSFVIPFSPPHECPNAQTCPNNLDLGLASPASVADLDKFSTTRTFLPSSGKGRGEGIAPNSFYNQFYCEAGLPTPADAQNNNNNGPESNQGSLSVNLETAGSSVGSTPMDSQMFSSSSASSPSAVCPFPTSIAWWQTLSGHYRGIIGYSDGTVCVVALTLNCPFIGSTSVERGSIEKLVVCRDNNADTITLMINTGCKEQWKLLLEQKSMGYTFPGEFVPVQKESEDKTKETGDDNWQFVMNLSDRKGAEEEEEEDFEKIQIEGGAEVRDDGMYSKLIPAAKARLFALRDMGAKKIGTLKLKLAESRFKAKEREKLKEQSASLALMEAPGIIPEILTTPAGPFFIVQKTSSDQKHLLSALHSYSDTLSVHTMDISLIPIFLYKLPPNCRSLLLTENVIYVVQTQLEDAETPVNAEEKTRKSTQGSIDVEHVISSQSSHGDETENSSSFSLFNAFGVVSRTMAITKLGDDCEFNERALVAAFRFTDEQIIGIHKLLVPEEMAADEPTTMQDDSLNTQPSETIVSNYFNLRSDLKKQVFATPFGASDACVLQNQFPRITFEPCCIVTDRNVYCIELTEMPHVIFLRFVDATNWAACEDFCKIFNLSLPQCIEFAGDVLLKKKKVTQALFTYNIARIPPIKTALKLAMFSEVNALMHLCAMAIKSTYLLASKFAMHPNIRYLVDSAHLRHLNYDSLVKNQNKSALKAVNAGKLCSDFMYDVDEVFSDLQMSNSSQFHLSNLLFLTLTERCIRDKNYMPLWNFIVTNTKFHTSLSSVVLSQSGLYSTAVLLAMIRGACLDVFSCLVGAAEQVLMIGGQEWNVFMCNISEEMFCECIIYLQDYAMEYFDVIRKHINSMSLKNLERLERQLNPYQAVFRPVMSKMLTCRDGGGGSDEGEKRFMEYCRHFIETYIIILMQTQALKLQSDNFLSALNLFRVQYKNREVDWFAGRNQISTGFSHAAYVTNGSVFIWGSNGVSCALSRNLIASDSAENTSCLPTCLDFFKELDIKVFSAHCGKSHTIFLTNNGVYGMGANQQGQLGVGPLFSQALQPQILRVFDGKSIKQICVGQYHNAVVADGLLYTWGWGIYGQLGHGSVDNQYYPKIVDFFRGKKVLQVSLGHAHSLVLCRSSASAPAELFVFGSNHYGQLGVGQEGSKALLKSATPLKLTLPEENIYLIQTKFFCNLAVTSSNQLYTWGLSPQAIRLATQARKRARQTQREAAKRPAVRESEDEAKPPEEAGVEDDPDLDDVFVEKANEEDPEKKVGVPEIKIDLAEEVAVPEPTEEPKENALEESVDHIYPMLVEGEFQSPIRWLASGLYHYTAVTQDGLVYTWGKNLEKQLGREGSRKDVPFPVPLENVKDVERVECGADFTVFLFRDGSVRACGNNNYGQCGREITPHDPAGFAGKLVRLRISKRLVRIPDGSQCIDVPLEVTFKNLVRSEPQMTPRVMKSLPEFSEACVVESPVAKLVNLASGHTTIDSNLNEFARDDTFPDIRTLDANENQEKLEVASEGVSESSVSQVAINKSTVGGGSYSDFIHYCLYIFHGLYDQSAITDFARHLNFSEYHLRILMLNYSYIEAFRLCIVDCLDATRCIKLFEYFTRDPAIVPTFEEDMKYFIYEIFKHFIRHSLNLIQLEEFFLADLDFYLIQLTYVLYFNNNNNSTLEKSVFQKFRHLFSNYDQAAVSMENTEVIFKKISTKFNVLICQRLIDMAETMAVD